MVRALLPLCLAAALDGRAAPHPAGWAALPGAGGGMVYRLAVDGSRFCAATPDGVYCTERDQEDWRPAFLQGREVRDLVKTGKGWVAIAKEQPTDQGPGGYRAILSRDGGAGWSAVGRNPGVNPVLEAYGDSLLAEEVSSLGGRSLLLSTDGGLTWGPIAPALPGHTSGCVPAERAILCVADGKVLKKTSVKAEEDWTTLAAPGSALFHFAPGRIFVHDTLGAVSVYGPAGLERSLPALPRSTILLASDSLIVAQTPDAYAYARRGSAAWTHVPAPHGIAASLSGRGVRSGSTALVLSLAETPMRLGFPGGSLAFEPFSRGLRSLSVVSLSSSGRNLLAATLEGIWSRDPAGAWSPLFRDEYGLSGFWHEDGAAVMKPMFIGVPARFSADGGKTWRAQPSSLPGHIGATARMGTRFLAKVDLGDPNTSPEQALLEARDWMGPWTRRAELGKGWWNLLVPCGRKLISRDGTGLRVSADTGRTWGSADFPARTVSPFRAADDRLYLVDSGAVHETRDCGETWTRFPAPWGKEGWLSAVNLTGGSPLAAVSHDNGTVSRVYPLPGAAEGWAGIESHPLDGQVDALFLHEGVLYAGVRARGLFAMDPPATGLRGPAQARRKAGRPPGFRGWRRVDGRLLPGSSDALQAPVPPPRFAR